MKKRLLFFTGRAPEKVSRFAIPKGLYRETAPTLSLKRYLDLLVEAQGAAYADSAEEADLILTIGKPEEERAVSLVDDACLKETIAFMSNEKGACRASPFQFIVYNSPLSIAAATSERES